MDQIALFANPTAGRGKAGKLLTQISHALQGRGKTVHQFFDASAALTNEELTRIRDCQAIIAIGGDGTVRQVVWRVIQNATVYPPFVVVPTGTANLLGQYLSLQWDPARVGEEIDHTIARNKTMEVDAASVSNAGAQAEELLLLVAGVGIDAKVVHEFSRLRRGPITKLSYAVPAALALGQYRFPPIEVYVDDKRVWRGAGIALVGNVKEYGTGFPILPHARPDDGLLDVCALPCTHPGELVKLFLSAAAGEHLETEGAVYRKGKSIRIESQEPVPVQVDGEAAGFTPVRMQLLPKRVRFLVP